LRALLSALALTLALGCAQPRMKPKDPGLFLLAPSAAGTELSVTQSLVFKKGSTRMEALAVLEVGRDAVSLVGMGPLGNRILSIRWDGSRLDKESDPHMPADLPLELILRDVQLAFWPAQALRQGLPGPSWTLEDSGQERLLRQGGKDVVRIRYGGADRWRSPVAFEHLGLGYSLEINPIKDEP
jgi:hypothetical protein